MVTIDTCIHVYKYYINYNYYTYMYILTMVTIDTCIHVYKYYINYNYYTYMYILTMVTIRYMYTSITLTTTTIHTCIH